MNMIQYVGAAKRWRVLLLCLLTPFLGQCGNSKQGETTEMANYPPTPANVRSVELVSLSLHELDLALRGTTLSTFIQDPEATKPGVIGVSSVLGEFGNPELRGKDPDTQDFKATVATANPTVSYIIGVRNTCELIITGFTTRYKVSGKLCDVVRYVMEVRITESEPDGTLHGTVMTIYTTDSSGKDSPVRHLGYETIAVTIGVAQAGELPDPAPAPDPAE